MSDNEQSTAGSGFGRFVPGFEFLQNLAGQAGGLAQNLGKNVPQMPSLGNWVAPTFNVEDLEKRIQELKAVHFWLDQNSKALAATIQALEVQKMTLATLQTMNLSMGDVANSLKVQATEAMAGFTGAANAGSAPAPASAPTQFAGLEIPPRTYGNPASEPPAAAAAPQASAKAEEAAPPDGSAAPAPAPAGVIDPMQWWGALSQQFQQIAGQAMQDAAQRAATAAQAMPSAPAPPPTPDAEQAPPPAPAPRAAPARAPAAKKAAPRRRATAPAAAQPQPLTGGDWPMPSAFFQLPGFPDLSPAQKTPAKPAKAAASRSGAAPSRAAARKPAAKKTPAKKAAPASRRR